jgi:histidinol dehydrogenase
MNNKDFKAPAVLKTAEQLYAATFSKIVEKACRYASEHDIPWENYVETDIRLVNGNDLVISCTNEYGSSYLVCWIDDAANYILTAREYKMLSKFNMHI